MAEASESSEQLVFVYNGESGLSRVGDLIHKTFSPDTYQCNLCALTYSGLRMNRDWRRFINSLPLGSRFLHRDEFREIYPEETSVAFPVVFVEEGGSLRELISSQEIADQKDLKDLKGLVQQKLSDKTTRNQSFREPLATDVTVWPPKE